MGLETGDTIAALNANWPLGTDPKSQGDDHIRLVKDVLKSDVLSISVGGTITGNLTVKAGSITIDRAGEATTAYYDAKSDTTSGIRLFDPIGLAYAPAMNLNVNSAFGVGNTSFVGGQTLKGTQGWSTEGKFTVKLGTLSLDRQGEGVATYVDIRGDTTQGTRFWDSVNATYNNATVATVAGQFRLGHANWTGQTLMGAQGWKTEGPFSTFIGGAAAGEINMILEAGAPELQYSRNDISNAASMRVDGVGNFLFVTGENLGELRYDGTFPALASTTATILSRQMGDARYTQVAAMSAMLDVMLAAAIITAPQKADMLAALS